MPYGKARLSLSKKLYKSAQLTALLFLLQDYFPLFSTEPDKNAVEKGTIVIPKCNLSQLLF
jgi:hypothetical protein